MTMICKHVYIEIENNPDIFGYKPWKRLKCEECGVEVSMNKGNKVVLPSIIKSKE